MVRVRDDNVLVFQFTTRRAAKDGYDQLKRLVRSKALGVTVYAARINNVPHVVVVGRAPFDPGIVSQAGACSGGRRASLSRAEAKYLTMRTEQIAGRSG